MIRAIVHDPMFLSRKALPAEKSDLPLARDLRDTLKANAERCVGMAGNMIGENKSVIIVNMGLMDVVMFNPELLSMSGPFETAEGCLSLAGERRCKRFREITVRFRDEMWQEKTMRLSGWTAQIVQHEVDHLHGILI